jgi:hypothetical protein
VFIMSENHLGCSTTAADDARPAQPTAVGLYVHVDAASVLDVRAIPAENRVVLEIGAESPATVYLFLNAADLDRLHALVDETFLDLGRPAPCAAHAAREAYASGWDAALAFCESATDVPVPAAAQGGPDA